MTSPKSSTVIRKIEPRDLAELQGLIAEHAAFERAVLGKSAGAAGLAPLLFADAPRLFAWVAEGPSGLLGYATAALECSTFDAALYLHMDCLFLRPAARNQGLGRRLMQALAQHALELGVTVVQWQTPDFNHDAIRFYRRVGAAAKAKVRFFLEGTALRTLAERG